MRLLNIFQTSGALALCIDGGCSAREYAWLLVLLKKMLILYNARL